MPAILTVSDADTGLELLGFAEKLRAILPEFTVEVLLVGNASDIQIEECFRGGAAKVYTAKELNSKDPEHLLTASWVVAEKLKPEYIVVKSDKVGKNFGSRLAQRVGAEGITDISGVEGRDGKPSFTRTALSGKAVVHQWVEPPVVLLISPGKFEAPKVVEAVGETVEIAPLRRRNLKL